MHRNVNEVVPFISTFCATLVLHCCLKGTSKGVNVPLFITVLPSIPLYSINGVSFVTVGGNLNEVRYVAVQVFAFVRS